MNFLTLNLIDFDGTLIDNDDAILKTYTKLFCTQFKDMCVQKKLTYYDIYKLQKKFYKTNIENIYKTVGVSSKDFNADLNTILNTGYPYIFNININETIKSKIKEDNTINIIVTHSDFKLVEIVLKHIDESVLNHIDYIVSLKTFTECAPKPAYDLYKIATYTAQMKLQDIDGIIKYVNIFEDSKWGLQAGKNFIKYGISAMFINTTTFTPLSIFNLYKVNIPHLHKIFRKKIKFK